MSWEDIVGLNDKEVLESREKFGSNSLTKYKKNSFGKLLLESFGDPIIKILLIALAIKLVLLFRHFDFYETIGILIAVFLASFISSLSEYGSEAAFEKLQEESSKLLVKVIRNGKEKEIPIEDVVVNDIVLLSSGDKVPADAIIETGYLSVDESSLNGETKEAKKFASVGSITEKNKLYRGSVIYNGSAKVKVTSVGDNTIYGKISKELQEKNPESPLKTRLRDLAKVISKIGYVGAILASLSYLFMEIVVNNYYDLNLIKQTLTNIPLMVNYLIYTLTLSVTIIVVAVPEGLPMMITLVLSSNMKKMLKDNVLVRKLVGIETAGSMNFLLTDKTGTLTKGELKLSKIISYDGTNFNDLNSIKSYPNYFNKILYSLYYNNECVLEGSNIIGGNSTDKALMNYIKHETINKEIITNKELFNSEKKYSSITINNITYLKGASEVLLPKCNKYYSKNGDIKEIDTKRYINREINNLTMQGNRVLILVIKENNDYIYLGLIVIKDELRKEAKEGVLLIQNAGIKLIMITGDAKNTAFSIAKEVGIIKNSLDIVLDSNEFNKLSDDEVKEKINNIKVIARSMPQDKSRLVKIIEEMNLVVGMTGDGVNDAPALKKANVGFAMGSGTEVAKEASDIVILDDNILSISKAILYGRTIFKSIRKFIIYQLSVNTCALIISIVGTLIGIENPITIIQMLWLNMIMDTFSGLAFSFEPPLKEYMEELPKKQNEPIMNNYMYSEIIVSGIYSSLLCLLFLKLPFFTSLIRYDINNNYLMTAYFAMFIFIGICNAFNARTSRINIFANLLRNQVFIIIFTFIIIVQIYIIYHGGVLFRTYGLTLNELLLVIILSLTALPIDFIRKILMKKKHKLIGV
jgi:Ca2+-transporting ATPase